ncbi:MAG: winged helix-turn-helix domain-containing protein [Candidatus Gracilibacteria bacterium]|nr:winged helix-turn-helix domain-containing protein [Candidatus Gracilibacteria bacterium]
MKNTTYKNVLITERDVNILKLLSKLKIGESDLIRDLLSSETSQNTFTKRLKKLEDKGLIRAINQDQRGRTRNKLYQLNTKQKKADIEAIIGSEILGGTINMSYSTYFHTLYIGYFLRFLIKQIKKKNENYTFLVDDFISQFEFQRWTTTRKKNELNTVIIPDGLLRMGNKVQWIECERKNSLKDFNKKMKSYKDQYFYLSKEGFCEFFKKDDKHTLLIMSPEWKIGSYAESITKEKLKEYYSVQLLNEDNVLKYQ